MRPFDLGQVLQTTEVIKGMRRQGESDKLRDAYLGQRAAQDAAQEKRAATQFSQEQQVQNTRLLHAAAAEIKQNPSAAERWMPQLQQAGLMAPDFDWRSRPPEQLQSEASHLFDSTSAALQALGGEKGGDQETFGQPQEIMLEGKPAVVQVGNRGTLKRIEGASPYNKPRGAGISFTSPDGTEVQIGGDGVPDYGGTQLSKPTRSKLEEVFTNSPANAYALREQLSKYKPEFSTIGGKLKAGVAAAKEQVGMENAPQQQQYLSDFTSWKADTARLLSSYLNQLSGAAISPSEEARLKSGFPNADDGPTQYQAKAQSTMRGFALAQARAAYLLSNPSQSLDSVSLDGMSHIITDEANRLAVALKTGGMDEGRAKQEAIARTRGRYGLDQQQAGAAQ
jgi:hypothetical protein